MRTQPRLRVGGRVALTILIAIGISVITYWLSAVVAAALEPSRPATCLAEGCFCEADAEHFPDQIANALSSFAFVLLGVWALLSTREPVAGTRERILKPYLAVTMLFLGISSFYYHATLTFVGQFLDVLSMYAFGILLTVGALYRSGRIGGRVGLLIFTAGTIVLGVIQFLFPEARRLLFALVLLPGIVLELTPAITGASARSNRVRFIYVGVGIMLVAYGIWILDQNRVVCDPDSLLQGHAIWHILSAVAAFMIFQHYRMTPHVRI